MSQERKDQTNRGYDIIAQYRSGSKKDSTFEAGAIDAITDILSACRSSCLDPLNVTNRALRKEQDTAPGKNKFSDLFLKAW